MRTAQDENCRRSNIYWIVKERLETEARIAGEWAKEDIKKAMAAKDQEMASFFSYFAGSKAREAASFAIMALDYKNRCDKLSGRKTDIPLIPGWAEPVSCPTCHEGYVVERIGPYGKFYGCSRYPQCRGKMNSSDLNQLLDPDPDEPHYGM